MGAVAVAGQRATRLLRLGHGGSARFAQRLRHQESRRRRPDRPHYLRKGPRRTGRELQGDGPDIALELLRRPAIRRRIFARCERFSHPEPLPKYGISGFPSLWWYDADKAARIGKRS